MKSLRYLNKYLWKYKWRLILGFSFIAISNIFNVQKPMVVRDAVQSIISSSESGNSDERLMYGFQIIGIYFLLSILSGIFLFFTRQTIIKMSRLIEFDLKNDIFKKYQSLDYAFYKKNRTGDLINRISEDVSKVRMYLGPGIMYSINLVVLSSMVVGQMVMINGKMTLFALIPLPLMSIIIYFVSKKINEQSNRVQRTQSALSSIIQESFTGIQTIKSFTQEERSSGQFDDQAGQYKKDSLKLVSINALFMPTILMLISLSTVLTIYVGGLLTYDNVVTTSDIIAFIFYVNMLTWPFASIGWVTSIIQRASASQTRINEFMLEQSEMQFVEQDSLELNGNIEFKNVSFTYENTGITALDNVSFEAKSGETIGIIGKTGSGKSTIVHLLSRLFDPEQGSILIDGKDLKETDTSKYRRKLGVVPQDVFLFSDSIENNINFGLDEKASLATTIEAAKYAHVHSNIERFEEKYDTMLGERGVNLSGGQKQRVSIARAVIKEPQILVFDDSFSAIDTETEEGILNRVRDQKNNPTTIIISHRISTLRHANQILLMEDGKILASGTHEELLQSSEYYRELADKQS